MMNSTGPAGVVDAALSVLERHGVAWEQVGIGRVVLTADGLRHPVNVQSHLRGRPLDRQALDRALEFGPPVVVAADYVSRRQASAWRERGVNYVDTTGNASVRLPGLIVEIRAEGRMPAPRRPAGSGPTARSSGLRVMLTLLAAPERAGDLTVREIAAAARVSVGSAQAVLADLRAGRHLHDGGLDRTGDLFQSWVWGYLQDRRLREPRHRFVHRAEWSGDDEVRRALLDVGAVLGGEDAAAEFGLPLRGSSGIIYAPASVGPIVGAAKLVRDDEGTLLVRALWWTPDSGALVAPTPLIYADLLASDDPRQIEIAAELRRTDTLLRRLDEA